MKRRYKVDYDVQRNCFQEIANVGSDLIWGDLDAVKDPFISYIIPVYKRADLLEDTLQSVLNQQPVDFPWDIVLVDNEAVADNDTEKLVRRLANPRILYYRNRENIGAAGNYNRCFELARAPWVAMLHGDDLIMDDHLKEAGRWLRELANEKTETAYIYHRYIEFTDRSKVRLHRPAVAKTAQDYYLMEDKGRCFRTRQNFGIVTGLFAALPSFGTIMNRRILLEAGGFDDSLGVCEDVIIPFRLANRYGVYAAPKIMGFYRLGNNESVKPATIRKIYASMVDFREYMYSLTWWGKLWGWVARNIRNRDLMNYCIGLSRHNPKPMRAEDFADIYRPVEPRGIRLYLFRFVIGIFNWKYDLQGYDEQVALLLRLQQKNIQTMLQTTEDMFIYGAGHVARVLIPLLRKQYGKRLKGCLVSHTEDNGSNISGLSIRAAGEDLGEKDQILVITATEIWKYQDEMNQSLKALGYKKIVNLLE